MDSGDGGAAALDRWFDRQLRAWRRRFNWLWWLLISLACASSLLAIASGIFLSWSTALREVGLRAPMHYTRFFVSIWKVQKPIEDYFGEWYLLLGLLVGWSLCATLSVPDDLRQALPRSESYGRLLARRRLLLLIVLLWIIVLPDIAGYMSFSGNFRYSDPLFPYLGWTQAQLVLQLVVGTWLLIEFCAFCQYRFRGWALFLLMVVLPVAVQWFSRIGLQLLYALRISDLLAAGVDPFAAIRTNPLLRPEAILSVLAIVALLVFFRWRNDHPKAAELEKS